jgi:hypothetical protein
MLEDTIEEMSTTFVGLSDSVLDSEHIRSHPQLITSVGDSVKRALTLAENATRGSDEETEDVDDDQESPQDQYRALAQSERASSVPVASSQGQPAIGSRFLTMNEMGMQDFYTDPPFKAVSSTEAAVPQRNPVPQNISRMVTQNAFFTNEFWGGDYTTTAEMHFVESPARQLPFWERLLRPSSTSVIHQLTNNGMRGDTKFCTRWEARGFKCSLRHKSKANLLARTRWILATIAASDARADVVERDMAGPNRTQTDWRPHIEAYFDNDDLRAFGAATMHSMILAGFPVESFVNAEEVENYLKEKGMVEVGNDSMQMKLTIPTAEHDVYDKLQAPQTRTAIRSRNSQPSSRSRSNLSRQCRPQKRMVTISMNSLLERPTKVSICTGNGIGYPKGSSLNAAIVASVIRIGRLATVIWGENTAMIGRMSMMMLPLRRYGYFEGQ